MKPALFTIIVLVALLPVVAWGDDSVAVSVDNPADSIVRESSSADPRTVAVASLWEAAQSDSVSVEPVVPTVDENISDYDTPVRSIVERDFGAMPLRGDETLAADGEFPTAELQYDYLMGKSRRLRRAAWITLGAGAFVAGGGTLAGFLSTEGNTAIGVWSVTWVAGGLSMLASVPLFITSHHYMRLAKRTVEYSFNINPIKVIDLAGYRHNVPALGVTIRF